MTHENLTTEQILAKLDQTSKKTRTISIALTLLLVLILAVVSYFTYSGAKELSDLQAKKNELKTEKEGLETSIVELTGAQEGLRKEKEKYEKLVSEAKACLDSNSNCPETKNNLANIDTSELITKPTQSPTPQKSPDNSNTATTKPPIDTSSQSKVYIQIVGENQRTSVKQIIQKLAGGNFKFPGIELVERKVPQTQVRYFREEDKTKANELVDRLKKSGVKEVIATSPYKTNSPLEIWFSNDAFDK